MTRIKKKIWILLQRWGAAVEMVYSDKNRYKTTVIGVTEDWDKAVDGNCNETAVGCVYVIR